MDKINRVAFSLLYFMAFSLLLFLALDFTQTIVDNWRTAEELEIQRLKADSVSLRYTNDILQKNVNEAYTVISENDNIELLLSIESIACDYGLDYHLVLAVIMQESRFDPHAVSEANAKGLMQVMDNVHPWVDSNKIFEPRYNVNVGCKILKNYIEQEGSIKKGLRAYFGKCDKGWRYAQEVLLIKQTLDKLRS